MCLVGNCLFEHVTGCGKMATPLAHSVTGHLCTSIRKFIYSHPMLVYPCISHSSEAISLLPISILSAGAGLLGPSLLSLCSHHTSISPLIPSTVLISGGHPWTPADADKEVLT